MGIPDFRAMRLEKLAVRVESLNVWWYPIEDCEPYHGKMPSWIRSLFREFKNEARRCTRFNF